MNGSMLITGASGVVGWELTRQAASQGWEVVGCASRARDGIVPWIMGAQPAPRELRRHWDVVVHAAARPRVDMSPSQARLANIAPVSALDEVVGTRTHLIHVSSAYATGLRGAVSSTELGDYRNSYEWSKAGAERLVTERFAPLTIVRPCLIIGRRSDGAVARFTGLYEFVYGAAMGLVPQITGVPEGLVDLVSACDVAGCVLPLAGQAKPERTRVETLGRGAAALTAQTINSRVLGVINEERAARRLPPMASPPLVPPRADKTRGDKTMAEDPDGTKRPAIRKLMDSMMDYLAILDPLPVTWPIEPVEDCLEKSVRWWLERRPEVVSRPVTGWEGTRWETQSR